MKSSGALYLKYEFNVHENVIFKGHIEVEKDSTFSLKITDKVALKLVDKKDFELKMKKRKRLFSKETADSKKFKLNLLAE